MSADKEAPKPVCKYGSSCYRKNPRHLKTYSHPCEVEYGQLLILTLVTLRTCKEVGGAAVGRGDSCVYAICNVFLYFTCVQYIHVLR